MKMKKIVMQVKTRRWQVDKERSFIFFIDVKSAVPRYVLILFDAASIYSTVHKLLDEPSVGAARALLQL